MGAPTHDSSADADGTPPAGDGSQSPAGDSQSPAGGSPGSVGGSPHPAGVSPGPDDRFDGSGANDDDGAYDIGEVDAAAPRARVAAAIRRERMRADLSLSELARRAGIGKSTMSGLEAGTGNPSLETMWALAAALNIPLSRLLDPPQHEVALLRTRDLPSLPSTSSNYVATLLSTSPAHARRDIYLIQAEPGEPRISHPHPAGTIEHVIVGSGAARIDVLGETYELRPGDYLTHPGDQPHTFAALEPGTNAVFVVESS